HDALAVHLETILLHTNVRLEAPGDLHELRRGPGVHARPVHDLHLPLHQELAHRNSPRAARPPTASTTVTAAGRQARCPTNRPASAAAVASAIQVGPAAPSPSPPTSTAATRAPRKNAATFWRRDASPVRSAPA